MTKTVPLAVDDELRCIVRMRSFVPQLYVIKHCVAYIVQFLLTELRERVDLELVTKLNQLRTLVWRLLR